MAESGHHRQRGFTLIEIMAVVLLLGLILTGVSSNMGAFVPAYEMDSQSSQILSHLDLARSSAIAAGRPYRIVVDLEKQQYLLYEPFDSEGRVAVNKEEQNVLIRETLPKGVHFAGIWDFSAKQIVEQGQVELVFPPDGIFLDVFLYLRSDFGEQYARTVHMGGLTGRTSVSEGQRTPDNQVTDADF